MDEIVGPAAKKYLDCQCLFFLDEIVGPTAKIIWIFNACFFLDRQSPALMSLMRLAPEELISPEQSGFSVTIEYNA